MSRKQPDDSNVLDAAGDDRDTKTIDSEVVTLEPRGPGPGPTPQSVPIDIKMDPGTVGAGAATPVQEQSHRFGPRVVPD